MSQRGIWVYRACLPCEDLSRLRPFVDQRKVASNHDGDHPVVVVVVVVTEEDGVMGGDTPSSRRSGVPSDRGDLQDAFDRMSRKRECLRKKNVQSVIHTSTIATGYKDRRPPSVSRTSTRESPAPNQSSVQNDEQNPTMPTQGAIPQTTTTPPAIRGGSR